MVFRSKYSILMTSVMIATVFIFPWIMICHGFNWACLIFGVVYAAFVLDLIFRTSYTISGNKLKLRAGLFSSTIDINKIRLIEHVKSITNNNSYAWSSDRLMIHAPRGYKYEVSPKDEAGFIEALKQINPELKVL